MIVHTLIAILDKTKCFPKLSVFCSFFFNHFFISIISKEGEFGKQPIDKFPVMSKCCNLKDMS